MLCQWVTGELTGGIWQAEFFPKLLSKDELAKINRFAAKCMANELWLKGVKPCFLQIIEQKIIGKKYFKIPYYSPEGRIAVGKGKFFLDPIHGGS
jgi:hypothetical protein